MKKTLLTAIASVCMMTVAAQTENNENLIYPDEFGAKDFGGYILDMGTMLNAESLVLSPPSFSTLSWDAGLEETWSVNPEAFRIDRNLTSWGGKLHGGFRSDFHSLLYPGTMNSRVQLQGASYRFNNGIRLNTYGEYDADGYKRYNPAALPWERNNFNAAFEMKSDNGKFGIRIEVQKGRNHPF